jgi:hypothetical protein
METYAIETMASPCRVDDELQRQIEVHARCLHGLIEGARHTEVFLPCAC